MTRKKSAVGKTRFTLWLPGETLAHLEELQKKTGKSSIAEVVRDAIEVYGSLLKSREDGVELYFKDKQADEFGKIWLLPGPAPQSHGPE